MEMVRDSQKGGEILTSLFTKFTSPNIAVLGSLLSLEASECLQRSKASRVRSRQLHCRKSRKPRIGLWLLAILSLIFLRQPTMQNSWFPSVWSMWVPSMWKCQLKIDLFQLLLLKTSDQLPATKLFNLFVHWKIHTFLRCQSLLHWAFEESSEITTIWNSDLPLFAC